MRGMPCSPGCMCGRHRPHMHNWRGEAAGTDAKHVRVRNARGVARDQACVRCDRQAREWATIHGETGDDVWADYVPLCRSCHLAYDRDARINPVSLARHKASVMAWWTPERRAAHGEKIRQARRSGNSR